MRLFRARGSAELEKVASGWAFGWETEKWDLRQAAKTEADFLGEEQLGKLGEEDEVVFTSLMMIA